MGKFLLFLQRASNITIPTNTEVLFTDNDSSHKKLLFFLSFAFQTFEKLELGLTLKVNFFIDPSTYG